MATQYVSTTLDANIYQDLELEIEIDTDEIAEQVAGEIDVADSVEEALSTPSCIVALAQGIVDLNESRIEANKRRNEQIGKLEELANRVKVLEAEIETAQMGKSASASAKPCEGGHSDES